jgi:hypothetical protein
MDDGADHFTRQVRQLWENRGLPGRTIVIKATPHPGMRHDLSLLLRASEAGRPITGLREEDVAAAFEVDVTDVRIEDVARQHGRGGGPGWKEVHVTPDAAERRRKAPTAHEWWADRIGAVGGPVPGSEFVREVRDHARRVTHYIAQVPDEMGEPRVNKHALAAALKTKYDEGRLFVTVDGSQVLVSLWDSSPLAQVFPATRELLTPVGDRLSRQRSARPQSRLHRPGSRARDLRCPLRWRQDPADGPARRSRCLVGGRGHAGHGGAGREDGRAG